MRLFGLGVVALLSACGGETLPVAGGGVAHLDDWSGRGVVINYWAEWCAPCREEIPEFNEIYEASAADGPIIVGVNYDALAEAELLPVIERMSIEFPTLLFDPVERFGYERPMVMPTTYILDGDLQPVAALKGPQTAETIKRAVREAIGTGTP